MIHCVCVFRIFAAGFFLLCHVDVVESFIKRPSDQAEFSSDSTFKLSSVNVLELLEPDRRISTQETHIGGFRTDLPPKHFNPYKQLATRVLRRPLTKPLKELSRHIGYIKLRDMQNIARGVRHPQQEAYIGKTIGVALKALQQENLSIRERIWALTILDGLRAYLPSRELIGIRTNVADGPVFRGALELHLAQGVDLLSVAQDLWLNPSAERHTHQTLAEALGRSEVLSFIKKTLQERSDYKLPTKLRILYDVLLQASFPITDKNDLDLIVACSKRIEIWQSGDLTTFAAIYHMMNHFMRHDQNIMSLVSKKLSSLPSGVWSYNRFMATSVKTDIDFLLRKRHDDYLENIFEPFLKNKHVGLSHFQHVVDVLKAQELALKTFKEEEYGIPFSHIQEYLMDTHSFLHILYRSSKYHPQEVIEYLDRELKWSGNRLKFKSGKQESRPHGVKLISIQEPMNNSQDKASAPRCKEIQETTKFERIHLKSVLAEVLSRDETLPPKSEPAMLNPPYEELNPTSEYLETTPRFVASTPHLKRRREEERDQCPLCMQEFEVAHRVIKLPCDKKVPHIFHERCLWPWYSTHTTCPNCRGEIGSLEKSFHVFWSRSETSSPQHKKQRANDDSGI